MFLTNNSGNVALGKKAPEGKLDIDGTVFGKGFISNPTGTGIGQAGELRLRELLANGTNYVGLKAPDSITSDLVWTLPSVDGTTGQVLTTNGSGGLTWTTTAANTTSYSVNQASHGFSVGDVVRVSGSNVYTKAQADTPINAEVAGFVIAVSSVNNFTLQVSGRLTGLTGLTVGEIYFLSPTTAGTITITEPTVSGQVSKSVLYADTTTSGIILNHRGVIVDTTTSQILQTVYPVGSIYTTVIPTNPNVIFGFGTWVSIAAGRTLVGVDPAQVEFDTVEKTGGAKTHTLTIAEMPAHTHGASLFQSGSAFSLNSSVGTSHTQGNTASVGGGGAHNNLQPYITVHFWKRVS